MTQSENAKNLEHKTDIEYITELEALVKECNGLLKPEILFFSTSIHPSKAAVIRESCLYRITELVSSALECFRNKQHVSAFTLCRSVMETESLFIFVHDEMNIAMENQDPTFLNALLKKVLAGTRIGHLKDQYSLPEAIHVSKLVRDKIGKRVPHYFDQYESLSEFLHPNGMGISRAYVRIDRENMKTTFAKSGQNVPLHLALPAMIGSLQHFLMHYHVSEETIRKLTAFYEMIESM